MNAGNVDLPKAGTGGNSVGEENVDETNQFYGKMCISIFFFLFVSFVSPVGVTVKAALSCMSHSGSLWWSLLRILMAVWPPCSLC